jgi:hypothetical protein
MIAKFRFAAALLLALAGSVVHQAAHAYVLTLQASPNPVSVGGNVVVSVMLDDPKFFTSADIGLTYSSTLLKIIDRTPLIPFINDGGPINEADGTILFSFLDPFGLGKDATGPLAVAQFTFEAIAQGSAVVFLTSGDLGFNEPDPDSTFIADVSDARAEISITGRTVRVPEPGSLALLGVAMAAAGYAATRRRRAA